MFSSIVSFVLSHLMYFALHITNTGSFPKALSPAEERTYLEAYHAGDMHARDVLIEHNLRLVAHIIKKYYSTYADQEDLISIGTIGLIKAVNTFDAKKGTRLATYAARCIENEILMHFRVQKKNAQDVYMSDPIDMDSEGNPLTLMDIICTGDTIADDLDLKIKSESLRQYIAELRDERERKIIILRYGLNGLEPLTQREVAAHLNISRSYVSRIEKKTLEKLRKRFETAKPKAGAGTKKAERTHTKQPLQ